MFQRRFVIPLLFTCSAVFIFQHTLGAEPGFIKDADGGYRYTNALYTAVIDNQGRLQSLQVSGVEMLSQADVNPKGIGASFIGGADSRTLLTCPP